jgi:EAL domain-containing protein (putative c-di-GMP-specific phosphodiesterase class I)
VTTPAPIDLLRRYLQLQERQFTRTQFLAWAAHHGLSRRIDSTLIDAAFTELRNAGEVVVNLQGLAITYRRPG